MTYIIYHKDCMDGVSSASIAEAFVQNIIKNCKGINNETSH